MDKLQFLVLIIIIIIIIIITTTHVYGAVVMTKVIASVHPVDLNRLLIMCGILLRITKVLRIVDTVVLIGRLMRVYYQQMSNCCRPVLTPSVTDRLLIMYGILLRRLFFVAAVVYSGSWDFFIWPM